MARPPTTDTHHRDPHHRGEISQSWCDLGRALVVAWYAARRDAGDGERDQEHGQERGQDRLSATAVAEVRQRFAGSLAEPTPFSIVAANAGLATVDAEVLAVALTCETEPSVARLLASSDPTRPRLTLGHVIEMIGSEGVQAVGADQPLRASGLIDVVADGAFVDHAVVVPAALTWALLGDPSVDPDLPPDADLVIDPGVDHADGGTEHALAEHALLVVSGADRELRRSAGARHGRGDRFVAVTAPTTDAGWAAVVRDATITGRGVIVEIDGRLGDVGRRWVDRARHLTWVISSQHEPAVAELPRRPWVEIAVTPREVTDAEWRDALGDVERTHRLTHDQLATVRRVLPAVGGDVDTAVRRLVSGRMEQLARRIRPTRHWDDIVLSPDRMDLLRSLVERYRYADTVYDRWGFSATPSRGLVALFSGPSGTGKTMATEIIAGVLGLDVFKLDLSAVVSKYIGETEKNLEEIFDAASAGNLVLFFDEADALFGKRSEVKDARDRYANIEVSYLLQRLERYDGLVVLATNYEKNVDEAFIRRIHARIEFVLPGPDERRAIWDANLPAGAPLDDVDTEWLARRFELSGGSIRNAAVHAAFLAAAAGTSITMEAAVRGVARELRKMGRLLKPDDFGEHFAALADAETSGDAR